MTTINQDAVWKLLDDAQSAFLTTRHHDAIAARPMALYARRDDNAIYMLTSAADDKNDAIADHPEVALTVQEGRAYLSVSGRATICHDVAKIRALWSPFAKAWWDSPDDPDIRLITVTPDEAHYWETPGRLLTTIAMLAAAVTGGPPAVGKDGKVSM
ncbi:MAG: pyridoxamine 5'-phosphate oxidase family protein [Hyphomonadaceae bacterium]|nr:pyridoxamine 5'-phosphate oxidase family protein [Hyphomonadaceae bacterium]